MVGTTIKNAVTVDTTIKNVSWLAQPTKLYVVVDTTNKNAVTVDTTIKIVRRGWHNQQNCVSWLAQPTKWVSRLAQPRYDG
jgi:hypothetical protein